MSLLHEIEFGSFLVYSPRATTDPGKFSKAVCYAIKQDGSVPLKGVEHRAIPLVVHNLARKLPGSPIESLFKGRPILVPAPRSAPLVKGGLYPTKIICDQLSQSGMGGKVQILLERRSVVQKAAFAPKGMRPTSRTHYESIEVCRELENPASILVVDDVITTGSTLLAAASCLKDAFPDAEIRVFAMVRTMSYTEVENAISPCVGKITLNGSFCNRVP
jgi:phosphoribosylpyrophosphate synthetase